MKIHQMVLTYLVLIIFLSQINCLQNFQYAKQWKWKSNSRYQHNKFNEFISHDTMVAYADLPEGIEIKDNATVWSVELPIDLQHSSNKYCFGLYDIEDFDDTTGTSSFLNKSISACTNGSLEENLGSSAYVHIPFAHDKKYKGKYDMILTDDNKFIISNERYGKFTKIEFTIDPTKTYFPFIESYSYSSNYQVIVKINACSDKCSDCEDWVLDQCTSCKYQNNVEDAPSCDCKKGFTHYYNHQANNDCQPEPNYFVPTPQEYVWQSTEVPQPDNIHLGQYEYNDSVSSYIQHWVELLNGVQIKQYGTKWTIEIKEGKANGAKVCFGFIDKLELGTPDSSTGNLDARSNSVCTNGDIYEHDSTTSVNGRMSGYHYGLKDQKFDIIFTATTVTITNIHYYGSTDVEFTFDNTLQYAPYIQFWDYNGSIRVSTCSPRCSECEYFYPEKCISCNNAVNRNDPPNCECKDGKQDEFIIPNINKVQPQCINHYVYYETSPQEWKWVTRSQYSKEIKGGVFRTINGSAWHNVLLGSKGIEYLNDGTKWSVKIVKLEQDQNVICIGVQKTNTLDILQVDTQWESGSEQGALVCTDGSVDKYSGYEIYQIKDSFPQNEDAQGQIFDLIYYPTHLIITNEAYNGNVRYELELNQYVNYMPHIHVQSTSILRSPTFQVFQCNKKCATCKKFDPDVCITCSDPGNRSSAPNCLCNAGLEDFYNGEQQEKCRQVPTWKTPAPPQWIWYTESSDLEEQIDIGDNVYNFGTFETQGSGHTSIRVKNLPTIENLTKWTVRIKKHDSTNSKVCFGIINQSKSNIGWTSSGQFSDTISQCTTGESDKYDADDFGSEYYTGQLEDKDLQVGQQYDLFYEKHQLKISNLNYGGKFERIFPLNELTNYTPIIYLKESLTAVQVKGCSTRCKTCVDFDPNNCLSCSTIENRNTAPTCTCLANFDDIFGGKMQDQCEPSEYYNQKQPPEWEWVYNGYESYDYAYEDIGDGKENYGTFKSNDEDVSYYVKSKPVLENYTSWTVRILEHNQDGKMCFGVVEAQQFLTMSATSYQPSYMSCFSTDNKLYNKFGTTNGETIILYDMPSYQRESLNGETLEILYKRDMLTITNENFNGQFGGRKIKAEIKLDPGLTYMPFIATEGVSQKIQFKGCSKRCYSCIDWQPKQCLICNDKVNRSQAPCCECNYGFTDVYNGQTNEKCQTIKQFDIVKYPEWEWKAYIQSTCSNCGEVKNNRGVFASKQNVAVNVLLDDYKVLTAPTQWRVKIKSHTDNAIMCFGVRRADLDPDYYHEPYSVSACTTGDVHKDKAFSKVTYSDFPNDRRENSDTILDIIFEPDYLQVVTQGGQGGINAEFALDPFVQYTPFIHMQGISDEIQVLHCNLKCKTCKDWFPNECYTCQGSNRVDGYPCGCLEGFTDFYQSEYHKDCIPIAQYEQEHPHPDDWQYITNNSKTFNEGNGVFKTQNGSSMIYVDLGREGIIDRPGGTKWSVQILYMSHSYNDICIGAGKVGHIKEYQNTSRDNFPCLLNNDNSSYDNQAGSNSNKIDNLSYEFQDYIGKRFDVLYDKGFLKITDKPYGGFKHYEFELWEELHYVPMIYSNSYNNYENIINTRPCHYKCDTCESQVDTKKCTVCADTQTRDSAPDCACKPGYFENPDGYYKCSECKHPCQSCVNETTCNTCILQSNRKNNPPDCGCELGYYNTISNECKACHYKCQECQETEETCTKCQADPNRNQSTCECIDGYYESEETKSCAKCPNSCKTCNDGSGICTECACDRIGSDGNGGICSCPVNSFGLSTGDEGQCQLCVPPCATCTSETVCNTCLIVGSHRQPSPSCLCEEAYYEDEFNNCRACMKGCQICEEFAYRCKQCKIDPNRNQDVNYCNCNEGYIESPATGMCIEDICLEKCAQCVPGDSTLCSECAVTPNRKSVDQNCDCVDGFYDDGTLECKACPYPCEQCTSPTVCITCITTLNRNYPPSCTCLSGSYEDSGKNCAPCSHQCKECYGDADNCTVCILEVNRSNTGLCNCLDGYVENPATKKCQVMTSCAPKCDTCNQSSLSTCKTCTNNPNANRKGIDDNCECKDMFFEVDEEECKACVTPCKTCENLSYCLECALTGENRQEAPNCTCYDGYIEDEDKNCILSPTGCPRQEGRSTDGTCVCLEGYFENENGNCQKCKEGCARCVDATGCLRCAEGYKLDSLPNCIICDLVCADCGTSPSECIRCAQGRHQPPECQCMPNYYDDGTNPQCYACEEQCDTCEVNAQNCIKCKGSPSKRYEAPNCKCWEGYYENSDNNNECEACDYKCLTCEGTSDNCLICRDGIDRILQAPSCQCKFGTYPTPYNNNCEFCSSECQTTTNTRLLFTELKEPNNLECSIRCKSCDQFSMKCEVCQPGKNTNMIPPKCDCLDGYYEDIQSQECQKCHEDCLTCSSENKCDSCKQTNMIPNYLGQCLCRQGLILHDVKKECTPCYYYKGTCYQQCPEKTYQLDKQYQCISQQAKSEMESILNYENIMQYSLITVCIVLTVFASKTIFSRLL